MSIPQPASFQPDEWVEEKIVHAKQRTQECRAELEQSIMRHPLGSVALGFGAGYLAKSLPMARLASTTLRIALAFTPHILLALGAARAWQVLRSEDQTSSPILAEPDAPDRGPSVASFPGP